MVKIATFAKPETVIGNSIGDRANIKLTKMTRAETHTKRSGQPTLSKSQCNEVLFFAKAHFLFFNFISYAQNTLSFFCHPQKSQRRKKMKECFFPTPNYSIHKS